MPELPEVYSIVKILNETICDENIKDVYVKLPKIVAGKDLLRKDAANKSELFIKNCKNKNILSVDRFGKIIILRLDKGFIIVHLKMTGQLLVKNKDQLKVLMKNKHTHVIFVLDNKLLVYNDIRTFGYVIYENELEINEDKVDPIGGSFELIDILKTVKSNKFTVKKWFLDQTKLLGIGNIYSDEICFDAKILPYKIISQLTDDNIYKLQISIIKVLNLAILNNGSSISDYLLPNSEKGTFQNHHQVYGRHGKNCNLCSSILLKIKIAGRTTTYCSTCQN